jgi:hypothetical protein
MISMHTPYDAPVEYAERQDYPDGKPTGRWLSGRFCTLLRDGQGEWTYAHVRSEPGHLVAVQLADVRHPAGRFWIDEGALAELAELCPVYDDQDAAGVLTTAMLGSDGDQAHAVIRGGCEIAADLLADHAEHGEVDGWRIIIHPSSDLDAPWIASHIFRVSDLDRMQASPDEPYDDREGSYDTAEIIRETVRTANEMLKWSER